MTDKCSNLAVVMGVKPLLDLVVQPVRGSRTQCWGDTSHRNGELRFTQDATQLLGTGMEHRLYSMLAGQYRPVQDTGREIYQNMSMYRSCRVSHQLMTDLDEIVINTAQKDLSIQATYHKILQPSIHLCLPLPPGKQRCKLRESDTGQSACHCCNRGRRQLSKAAFGLTNPWQFWNAPSVVPA